MIINGMSFMRSWLVLYKYLPYFIFKPLFGDRKKWGLKTDFQDSDFRIWQDECYLQFYNDNQKGSIGTTVNHFGFQIINNIDLTDKVILEVGPGSIEHLDYNSSRPSKYILADINQNFLTISKKHLEEYGVENIQTIQVNGLDIPLDNDSDDDGIPDGWEVTHGLDPLDSSDASGDSDGDGLTNLEEYELNTDPQNVDSDSDGIPDSWEIQYNLDPTDSSDASLDPDGDGLSNLREYELGTDPHNSDSDGDGFSDGLEVLLGTDPLSSGDSPLFTRILPPVMIIVFVVIVKIIIVVRRRALISFVREWSRKRYEL